MAHKNQLRKDKTCLNCNYVVENRFCSNCGQENSDTRKTFFHLFVHFFEDLTHYENAFWKTIKNLLLRPASLTKEYLSGKRLSYLAPVRLYIFISFVTFLLIAIFPNDKKSDFIQINDKSNGKAKNEYYNYEDEVKQEEIKDSLALDSIHKSKPSSEELKIEELKNKGILKPVEADSLKKFIQLAKKDKDIEKANSLFNSGYKSIAQMDSIRKVNPDEIDDIEYWLAKKTIPLNDKYTNSELWEKFTEEAKHNFPKTLFIYMPLFAFVLWLFHNKKRWYYFDHGIFTLHYFSFLLLVVLILFLTNKLLGYFDHFIVIKVVKSLINFVGYLWMFYYFFPAHHRFYGESRTISFFKSMGLLLINIILISIVLLLFVVYTFINIH
ncbi:DUF3667 domain-containing protein [Flavobacterium sp. SUN052]|uniref:DUF3667 domain-containing protein n=1 Tax=Flavobacterium sp. SUN052 TaxID=3002441 RepID=UPI00237EA950|nr:DUF3667 domain-containing protein [Flavobacterium sp. SUN052]MEC4003650.1 DUF3667 domain-containing protein [Flavobacterium sp. SUN052]